MSENKNISKSVSFIIIVIIFCLIVNLLFPLIPRTKANSVWKEKNDSDFNNGTLDNIEIIGSGSAAELKLKSSTIPTGIWVEKSPLIKPSARCFSAMASVNGTDSVVLFGGLNCSVSINNGSINNETWVYNISVDQWTKKITKNTPSIRAGHAMATIYRSNKILLYGGAFWNKDTGFLFNDTWIYDLSNNTWINKIPQNNPGVREGHTLAPIWGTDKVLLFGGSSWGQNYGASGQTYIYDFSKNNWTNMKPIGDHPPHGGVMASVYNDDKVVLFFGHYNLSFNETWVYDLSNNTWTNKTPINHPLDLTGYSMTTIHGTDKVLLFGGYKFGNLNDTWIYDLSDNNWTKLTLTTNPNSRFWHIMASGSGCKKVLLFGGAIYNNGYTCLDDTWVFNYSALEKSGSYISEPYDTGAKSIFKTLSWNANVPDDTDIKFRFRSATSESILLSKDFVGPDGFSYTFYNSSAGEIWPGHTGDRWIQYKVYFNGNIIDELPSLKDITITYNCLPETTIIEPVAGSFLSTNKPTFKWTFKDYDSNAQKGFNVIISKNLDFENIDFDSGEQTTADQTWEFPIGTGYSEIPDGSWFWKIRTKDSDSDWGFYSEPSKIIIDTKLPTSKIIVPINNGFYNKLDKISGIAFDSINGSGLNKIEINIIRQSDNVSWDGSNWTEIEFWLPVIGTSNWSFDTSSVQWITGYYKVQSRATDNINNLEIPSSEIIFMYDNTLPDISIIINNNATYTNSTNVILLLTAVDIGSGISKVAYSKDGTVWSLWEDFNITKSYELSEVDGEKRVYYKVRDKVNNTAISQDTIIVDKTPPYSLFLHINNGAIETNSSDVTLTLHAIDNLSGVSYVSFSSDGKNWSDWEDYSDLKLYTISSGNGTKTIYFRVMDRAGNIAGPVSENIILRTIPQEIDTDGDEIPDDKDAFPEDPAASIDTDGDNYPDSWNLGKTENDSTTGLKLDDDPNKPNLDKKPVKSDSQELGLIIIIIIVIGLIIIIITLTIHRNNRQKLKQPYIKDKILKVIRNEVLYDKIPRDFRLTDEEIITKLEENYHQGEISDEAYQYIKIKIDQEKR